jgi:hypothetical protein
VEAATLAAALRVKQRNRSAGDGPGGPGGAGGAGGAGGPGAVVAGGHDLTDEVAWLTAVARAFAGSPVVVETLARTDAPEGATA